MSPPAGLVLEAAAYVHHPAPIMDPGASDIIGQTEPGHIVDAVDHWAIVRDPRIGDLTTRLESERRKHRSGVVGRQDPPGVQPNLLHNLLILRREGLGLRADLLIRLLDAVDVLVEGRAIRGKHHLAHTGIDLLHVLSGTLEVMLHGMHGVVVRHVLPGGPDGIQGVVGRLVGQGVEVAFANVHVHEQVIEVVQRRCGPDMVPGEPEVVRTVQVQLVVLALTEHAVAGLGQQVAGTHDELSN